MENLRNHFISVFAELGQRLDDFGKTESSVAIIHKATNDNPWFNMEEIILSVSAIRNQMLDREKLMKWLENYTTIKKPKKIGLIMAGNIPLVGFFDLLCIVCSGHHCYYKPSSKDKILIDYFIESLKSIDRSIPIQTYHDQPLDAIIATGSDNTKLYFRTKYSNIPALLRGSRSSVAILSGDETPEELIQLGKDIFTYSGLGCRNVSHILVPEGYSFDNLTNALKEIPVNSKYINNYIQRSASLNMQDKNFIDGGTFILRFGNDFPSAISEITYQYYHDSSEIKSWIAARRDQIQCIIGFSYNDHKINFGQAQMPSLYDYADNIDVMNFLTQL